MATEIQIIEKSFLAILKALLSGKFTRPELELLQRLSQEVVNVTEKKLYLNKTEKKSDEK